MQVLYEVYLIIISLFFSTDIKNLNAEEFSVRENSQIRLIKHNYFTWRLCDKKFPNAEQNQRAKRVVESYLNVYAVKPLPEVMKKFDAKGDLWIGYWYNGDDVMRVALNGSGNLLELANHYLFRVTGVRRIESWHVPSTKLAQEEASRLLARDLLRLGIPRSVIIQAFCQ